MLLNIVFLQIEAMLEQSLPSNSSRTIGSPEQNTRRSQSVATASGLNTPTHVGMAANDGQQASNSIVCVAQLFSMTDSRTERLCVLLMASNSHCCKARMYLIQLSLMSVGFPKKYKHSPQMVTALA